MAVEGLCGLKDGVTGRAYRMPQSGCAECLISASWPLGSGSSHRAKERLKGVWRDSDRIRDAHMVQFAALAEAVHRGRGHAEPCSHLFDREKRAEPNRASDRSPDHGRTKILGKRRYRLERIGQVLLSVL